jgi:hypothetical protein
MANLQPGSRLVTKEIQIQEGMLQAVTLICADLSRRMKEVGAP